MKLKLQKILPSYFIILFCAVFFIGFLAYRYYTKIDTTNRQILLSKDIIGRNDEVHLGAKNLFIYSNKFLVTGNGSSLGSYLMEKKNYLNVISQLKVLTEGNKTIKADIDSLVNIINNLISLSDNEVASKKNNSVSPEDLTSKIDSGSYYISRVDFITLQVENKENDYLMNISRENDNAIVRYRNTLIFLLSGILVFLVTMFISVNYSFRQRAITMQELQNSNELFAKLFHESPAGAMISRISDGVILDCNEAYMELVGYNKEEIIGKSAVDLNIITPNQHIQKSESLANSGIVRDMEIEIRMKGGKHLWVSVSLQRAVINGSEVMIAVFLDFTDHKVAQENLLAALEKEKELNELKSQFVSIASHEFRTPLTTILSSISLIEIYGKPEEENKIVKHIERIKTSVENLTDILNDFLSLEKLEQGKIENIFTQMNLKEYIEDIVEEMGLIAKRKKQQINYVHEGGEEIFSDKKILRNILFNLISNALKYSREGNKINIASIVNGGIATISIKDQGIGIPEEEQAKLFSKFFRANNAASIQGTGLGLSIVRKYVELLGGKINFISRVNEGSTFIVEIPVSK